MFNLLTWPKKLADNLSDIGCEVILIDNKSTYGPLLEWYKLCPYKIHFLNENLLSTAFWRSGLNEIYNDEFYIVTDPDIDISEIPKNFIDILLNGLLKYPLINKAGLSLEINDLPNNNMAHKVIQHETKFWQEKNEIGFYKADIGATLAIYEKGRKANFLDAIRSPRPYTAKHIPWYLTENDLNEELRYYIDNSKWFGWMNLIK